MEFWADIEGFIGAYQVSNKGNVRSLPRISTNGRNLKGKLLTQREKDGQVGLYDSKGKLSFITSGILVARYFMPEKPKGYVIRHKDTNPCHSWVDNLEYVPKDHLMNVYSEHDRSVEPFKRVSIKAIEWLKKTHPSAHEAMMSI